MPLARLRLQVNPKAREYCKNLPLTQSVVYCFGCEGKGRGKAGGGGGGGGLIIFLLQNLGLLQKETYLNGGT